MKTMLVWLMALAVAPWLAGAEPAPRCLVLVLDGLRPDYVTPDLMPNLHGLAAEGVVATDHHAVFPTVTRVNATSIGTGAYPGAHGVMGNSVYFPQVSPQAISTWNVENLLDIQTATNEGLVTAESLGTVLEVAGLGTMVASSGSPGSAYLLNPTIAGTGIANTFRIFPAALEAELLDRIGPVPEESAPAIGRNRWAVDAYIRHGLDGTQPALTLMWLTDPDHTAHEHGIGTETMLASLAGVDAEVGRIRQAHAERGLADVVNIIVISDHGFSTHGGGALGQTADLTGLLVAQALKQAPDSTDVVVVDGAIYVHEGGAARVEAIVQRLQATPWVGPIFTKAVEPGGFEGSIPGTLSYDLIHWDHARAADILTAAAWSHETNATSWPGTTAQPGTAGHGTASPYDILATLIAAGPAFKSGLRSPVPTGNVDIAPTVCRILGVAPPAHADGRVLAELLRGGPCPTAVTIERTQHMVEAVLTEATYWLTVHTSAVDGHRYIDYAESARH